MTSHHMCRVYSAPYSSDQTARQVAAKEILKMLQEEVIE